MPCYHPIQAWRSTAGEIHIGKQVPDSQPLQLPCSGCLGCRLAYAQAWALRCQLELQQHKSAVFTTLTYDDEHLPNTLPRPAEAIPLWIRNMRRHKGAKSIRYYASAEYGERTKRPHFHAILYGLSMQDMPLIEDTWTYGHTRTEPISPARISYVAGYCHKKLDYKHIRHERVNQETGEVYTWEPPYKLMSRNPGIGGFARKWIDSWRLYAVKDGHKMAVPRLYKDAWDKQATAKQKEDLAWEKHQLSLKIDHSRATLQAAEKIATEKQKQKHQQRTY